MIRNILLVLGLATLSLPVLADGNVQAGKDKSARCQACHGAAGISAAPIYPNLAGQKATYLSLALHAYKAGDRNGGQAEVMKAFVAGMSDGDIDDLAAYYASLQP